MLSGVILKKWDVILCHTIYFCKNNLKTNKQDWSLQIWLWWHRCDCHSWVGWTGLDCIGGARVDHRAFLQFPEAQMWVFPSWSMAIVTGHRTAQELGLGRGPFRISENIDRYVFSWVPGLTGLMVDCGCDGFGSSFRIFGGAISHWNPGPSGLMAGSGCEGAWSIEPVHDLQGADRSVSCRVSVPARLFTYWGWDESPLYRPF